MKIILVAILFTAILIGGALGLFLSGSKYDQLPAEKLVADTMLHLMEMSKVLVQNSEQIEAPQLCNCCNATLIGGLCPICMGNCDQTEKYKKPDYHDIPCADMDTKPEGIDDPHIGDRGHNGAYDSGNKY
jgi:hypothetical protein